MKGKCVLENLKARVLEYEIIGEFLANIKKEFEGEDKKTIKVAELKKLEQRRKTMEEFV